MTQRLPFLRGQMYEAMKEIGPCTTAMLAAHLGQTRATTSKLLSVMVVDGNILTNGRSKAGRKYHINPQGTPPVDKRNKERPERKYSYPLVSWDTTPPWLFAFWTYLPYGLESKYCARIDTLRGEVCPKFAQAAE